MSKIQTIAQIVAGLALGVTASLTMPDANAKTVPAAACATNTSGSIIPSGGTMWALNGNGQVHCPVHRARNLGSLSSAVVDINAPTSGQYSCYLYATDQFYTSMSSRTIVNAGSGTQTRDFNASLLTTYNNGYYYVFCNIPQGGRLYGVRYEEN